MKNKRSLLVICIAIPLLVGGLSTLLTGGAMEDFSMLRKPPLSPPGWLFPVVWTILYTLMGISSYLVAVSDANEKDKYEALVLYGYQLAVNFLWPTFFFNFEWYLFSLAWLILLWVLVVLMIEKFWKIDKRAAWLNVPYLIWLTFATYLNAGIWWLNR